MTALFQTIYDEAHKAGMDALDAMKPVPMIVGDAVGLFGNQIDPSKPTYYVADGVCGFAWVNVRDGRKPFTKWLVKKGYGRKDDYYKGVTVWVRAGNQSMQKKEAYARAMAGVFSKYGIDCYADSRMD